MVQRDKDGLTREVDRFIFENTLGSITATNVNTLLKDFIDSLEFLAAAPTTQFTHFAIQGVDATVDPGFVLSGSQTFEWTLMNPGGASGTITIKQETTDLSTTIPIAGDGTSVQTVTSETFVAGETETFTISVTGATDRTFVVTARDDDDYLYYGTQTSSDFSTFDFQNESRVALAFPNTFTIPTFSGNEYLGICQPTTTSDVTSIRIDGLDQFDAFTVFRDQFTVNSVQYDVWRSDNALIGSIVSGDTVRVLR